MPRRLLLLLLLLPLEARAAPDVDQLLHHLPLELSAGQLVYE
eukprot:COSAG05_NODE_13079_length_442_cov_0.892128_1_plen_41_part_01